MANVEEVYLTDVAHLGDLQVAPDGDLQMIRGRPNVKEALFRRLMTQRGALAHRPNYGIGVKDFLNAPNSIANQRTLALRIKEQFELDPRVEEMVGMKVTSDDSNPEKVTIYVRVKLVGLEEQTINFVPFGESINGD